LTQASQDKVESALALKYWITLGWWQNYINSTWSIIWNTTTNSWYNNNIFWIWRDDVSMTYQKQSKSWNANALVTIWNGWIIATDNIANLSTFSTDRTFLIIWDNSWALVWTKGWPLWISPLWRKFKVQSTLAIPIVKLQVPDNSSTLATKLPNEFTSTWIVLLIDNDWDFSSWAWLWIEQIGK